MKQLAIASLILLAGCSNQAAKDYYLAVQTTALAQAEAAAARYDALARMSVQGSPESQTAAVMALALYQPQIAQPAFVEDQGLKWASVLAGPVAAVAGVYINSQQAVDLAKINQKTQIVGINAQTAQQTAAYAAISQGSSGMVSTANGLIDLTRSSLNLVDSTVSQSYGFATANNEQAYGFANASNNQAYGFGANALTQSYQFSGDVFGTTVDWAEFMQTNYQPVIVPQLVITPIEITPVIVNPTP